MGKPAKESLMGYLNGFSQTGCSLFLAWRTWKMIISDLSYLNSAILASNVDGAMGNGYKVETKLWSKVTKNGKKGGSLVKIEDSFNIVVQPTIVTQVGVAIGLFGDASTDNFAGVDVRSFIG
ncbi:MAG: hypothetical protein HC890_11725 [Chloroflexaceae bacterium]|nr:hypothetical protein [Chloroflexaceae bacterium]